MAQQVIAVLGPTAAGKSDLAIRLAQELDGEIINADSMQLYRGMDIGTAKLTMAQRRGVPHHLLDIWDVRYPANVAEYQQLARDSIAAVQARRRVAILVGGSGLYLRAALDDLNFPATDPKVRQRLEDELSQRGPAELYTRLAKLDPVAAEGILPSNGRRIVRALEVIEVSGQPFTATLPSYESLYPAIQLGLRVPRDELDSRIEQRVARMWQAGFLAEVSGLEAHGLREGRTASRALGYAQVLRFLAGEWTEQQAREETVKATRRFARRQDAWFRRDPRISWLDAGSSADQAGAGQHGVGQHGVGQHSVGQHSVGQHGMDLAQRALATIGTCGSLTSSSPRDMGPRTTS
jgi:tRNA dimethylallyltransferase